MQNISKNIYDMLFYNNRLRPRMMKDKIYKRENLYEKILSETSFLDHCSDVSDKERLLYIKEKRTCINMCNFCKNHRLRMNSQKLSFLKTCGNAECESKMRSLSTKNVHQNFTDEQKQQRSEKIRKFHSRSLEEKYGLEQAVKIKEKQSQRMIGVKMSNKQKEKISKTLKGTRTGAENPMYGKDPWNKGKTKEEDSRLELKKSTKRKLSKIMKDKIKNGEFKPNILNSWNGKVISIDKNGEKYKFRSSWEAVFFLQNNNLLYESKIIKYEHDGKDFNYIVDFINVEDKILYEIKPKSERERSRNVSKFKAAKKWCQENNYEFLIIDDDWFYKNAKRIDYKKYQKQKKYMKKFLND